MIKVSRKDMYGKDVSMVLDVTEEQLQRFERGEFAQDVFPNLSAGEREFLITGTTPEEWAKIFPPEEEEAKEEK